MSLPDRTAVGPNFTTEQPDDPAPLPLAAPGSWPVFVPTPSPSPGPAALPTIFGLADGNQQRLARVPQGVLFFIQGSGFGANSLGRGRVLFVTPSGDTRDGAVWDWSDSSIAAFAPSISGPMQVVVQVDVSGTSLGSNRVPLTVQ